jgi:hypothetical protein
MCEFLANLNWLEIIECAATVFTAGVALVALNTWKVQSKAQRMADFLDELTDEIHKYIQAMSTPVEVLKIIRIGLECYTPLPSDEYRNNVHANSIAYIEKRGKSDSARLLESLIKCSESISKIQSLIAKGQIYNFEKYSECQNACNMLLWQFQRLQVVASVIGSDSMNWNNPEVQKSIVNMNSVQVDDVQKHLQDQHVKYLGFAKANYHAIY